MEWWPQASNKRDLRAAAVMMVECMVPSDRFEAWRFKNDYYMILHQGGVFHQFTKLKVLLYGLIAFGHIPHAIDQFDYIEEVFNDTILTLENG
jgi:hypothetical protein